MKTLSINQLKEILRQFTGTEYYHQHTLAGNCRIFLTDGCKYLAEQAGCYWLFDLIASYQYKPEIRHTRLQVWNLRKQTINWVITCTDGNGNQLAQQVINYSDFPLDEFTIWFSRNVAMLPTEY